MVLPIFNGNGKVSKLKNDENRTTAKINCDPGQQTFLLFIPVLKENNFNALLQ
jgi:hypothetical protein